MLVSPGLSHVCVTWVESCLCYRGLSHACLTWVEARQSTQEGSAHHGHHGRDCTSSQNLRGVPHHEAPLVEYLEGEGEDDDSQEAHQEVASAV